MPDVTVLTTVLNGMPYLRQTVESLLDQCLRDWQCVIVNDGSTDGTREFLDSIRDERFFIIHQPNAGTAAAANRGLQHCDTRYTARMDADDISLADRLARQVGYLDANPTVGMVGVQMAPMGSDATGRSLKLPTDHEAIMAALRSGRHGMGHSCIMFRTELAKQIGGYWTLPLVDDWDFMLRFGEISRLANLDQVLHLYRIRANSLTGSAMSQMRFSIDYACELARRRQAGEPPIMPHEFRALRDSRPWWCRTGESIGLYARSQYRIALADLYGQRRIRGAARLAWAAIWAPQLTVERLYRMAQPARNATVPEPAAIQGATA